METVRQKDLESILPFLPLITRSSSLYWPPSLIEAFKCLSKGPIISNVISGEALSFAISDLRNSLGFISISPSASLGLSLFFDDLMTVDETEVWFTEVVPRLSDLLLRLPQLLENHYRNVVDFNGMKTGLRILEPQQSGVVFLSQELIAALLACSLFCLFPKTNRGAKHLPPINFDNLFVCLYESYDEKLENKIKCIVHYFQRISSHMPTGIVSFERKVLTLKNDASNIAYPEMDFWSESTKPLCKLEVCVSGLIEDQTIESLEVDFANKYLGGGALSRGCVQEEIRFMINPELIAGMLFLPSIADNESIEIVGAERFSNYTGYASTFRFSGNYEDKKGFDSFNRRKTRIIAIDALCSPGKRQYKNEYLLREINKAFCGFLDQKGNEEGAIGVATGNWGCGAFGGDPQIKAVIQWLAASQASRPIIFYHTFGLYDLEKLEAVVEWIVSHKWSVGELWSMLVEYSTRRVRRETDVGLFKWLLPSLYDEDVVMLDAV